MKLPAVAIAAAFAGGIALGLCVPVARLATSRAWLAAVFAIAVVSLLAALLFTHRNKLVLAGLLSLSAWLALGSLAALIAEQPLAANHIIHLVESERIDLHAPLRWHAVLRDEPARLPWGVGLEANLTGVDYQGAPLGAIGGMRISFTPHQHGESLPELHAGDQVELVAQAKRPPVFRDEGAFDRRAYLATQDIHLVATLRAPELIHRAAIAPPSAASMLARARSRLREQLDRLFASKPEAAAVLRAMLLGDRSFVERQEAADFQKTGVFHVLVVAGLHVGALAFFLYWLGRKLRLRLVPTMLFTLALLFAYVAVIEQRPPVLRAALMTVAVVLGGFFYRRLEILNSAAMAALLLLVAKPLALRDSSFQLTFLAIGCIAGLALPWLEEKVQPYASGLRGWRDVTRDAAHEPRAAQFRLDLRAAMHWLAGRIPARAGVATQNLFVSGLRFTMRAWELVVLTIALQAGMLPLMARDFHRITLSAPIANLFAVPLTGVVVPLGFATLAAAVLSPAAGRVLAIPLGWSTELLLHIVHWLARFPRWSYRIPGPPLWLIVSFFLVALLLAVFLRIDASWRRPSIRAAGLALASCSFVIAWFPFAPVRAAGTLEMSVLDVGQGDSILVVSPSGRTMLIDGGGDFASFGGQRNGGVDPGEDAVSAYLWSRGFQKLDVVALTHAHQDHLGGLPAVLENFHVTRLWIGREAAAPTLRRLEEIANARNITIEHESRGSAFTWDGVQGKFFWPSIDSDTPAPQPKNNDSLVLRLQYGDRTLLLPGDAEKDAEREMLGDRTAQEFRADVLKVGHHGSKNSTTPNFLAAVQPRWAIISAGEDNPYGHPSAALLERLASAGVRVLRTDRDGAIHVLTDGRAIEVSCFIPCAAAGAESVRQAQTPNQHKSSE